MVYFKNPFAAKELAAMAENKTKPSDADVPQHLAGIENEGRRKDCQALVKLMAKATGQPPKMWGTAIVGFGSLRYKYASGQEGETCQIGFSSRKGDISLYGMANALLEPQLLAKLGKHKAGKGCLYIRKLDDVDVNILTQLVAMAVNSNGT
jgi:hypothetical protein